jgi:hypothetical protein
MPLSVANAKLMFPVFSRTNPSKSNTLLPLLMLSPTTTSLPARKMKRSRPAPSSVSAPPPPVIVSLPLPPLILFAPVVPIRVSLKAEPVRFSIEL